MCGSQFEEVTSLFASRKTFELLLGRAKDAAAADNDDDGDPQVLNGRISAYSLTDPDLPVATQKPGLK